jgi:hypothetical protein
VKEASKKSVLLISSKEIFTLLIQIFFLNQANRSVVDLGDMLASLKERFDDLSEASVPKIARSFSLLRDVRGELEDTLLFHLTVNPSVPFYWKLQHSSVIENFEKTLDRLETTSRVQQHDEITKSLEGLIESCKSSIGNDSLFCTAFRIFNDTKVHKISSEKENYGLFQITLSF